MIEIMASIYTLIYAGVLYLAYYLVFSDINNTKMNYYYYKEYKLRFSIFVVIVTVIYIIILYSNYNYWS